MSHKAAKDQRKRLEQELKEAMADVTFDQLTSGIKRLLLDALAEGQFVKGVKDACDRVAIWSMIQQDKKRGVTPVFAFTSEAHDILKPADKRKGITEKVAVWDDGISLSSEVDKAFGPGLTAFRLKPGVKYKVTIEEVKE